MKRAKLGDVYAIKLINGYKLYQWAYTIPRKGKFMRVFDGLFDNIPNNIEDLVNNPHSYIIEFDAPRAYRVGLAQLMGNYAVPEQYPFPDYQVMFNIEGVDEEKGVVTAIHVMNSDGKRDVWEWFDVSCMQDLPAEYRNITLLNSYITPNWLFYMFDNGFDLKHPERKYLGVNPENTLEPYTKMVNDALNNYQNSRNKTKQ